MTSKLTLVEQNFSRQFGKLSSPSFSFPRGSIYDEQGSKQYPGTKGHQSPLPSIAHAGIFCLSSFSLVSLPTVLSWFHINWPSSSGPALYKPWGTHCRSDNSPECSVSVILRTQWSFRLPHLGMSRTTSALWQRRHVEPHALPEPTQETALGVWRTPLCVRAPSFPYPTLQPWLSFSIPFFPHIEMTVVWVSGSPLSKGTIFFSASCLCYSVIFQFSKILIFLNHSFE